MSTSNEGRNVKMLFRILKKDLKRKKVMNAILLCFILLATMFVASGISNVVSVMNGTDSYLDKAEIGDYVVISMGADSKASSMRSCMRWNPSGIIALSRLYSEKNPI